MRDKKNSQVHGGNIYCDPVSVVISGGDDKFDVLDRTLELSGFLDMVGRSCESTGKSKGSFSIAIKPNIMTASISEAESPVYTDPALLHHLVSRLRENGFTNISIVESRNVYDYSYQGRSVQAVAEMAGFTGDGYSIVDLSGEQEPHDYGGVLGLHTVGKTWKNADFRVSFAKNKTHWQCYYTGCMKNIYGCLPAWDKMKHYHGRRREFFECCILMLESFPVHFGFLDAWVSGDGLSGHVRDAKPNHTKTILASRSVYALDWVMGEKMGLNPLRNSVLSIAMQRWGTVEIERQGSMKVWNPWSNVWPPVVSILDLLEELYTVSRFMSRAFANRQDPRFPPVRSMQWLFGPLQRFSRALERLFGIF